ncbi:uncharacterized protein BDZ99DRAFT_515881 [Mytilinidion resinicola]|uniref:Uncharacterized protein n=1 Tax=Mytilinidion resinicola TaxID=574789 RepID=A0A6A6Z2T6_9PEZI|nr:uncharacterized protein BDZ99DRAFT_515881 [Mytilinidion resinicola]KAF2815128.1 hypothetical protein BDZ99DRAFT_515881 [Mytilinidion resinicola]
MQAHEQEAGPAYPQAAKDEASAAQPNQVDDSQSITEDLTSPGETIPDEKSDVALDPNAPDQSRKFSKHDPVHMMVIAQGVRMKKNFTVYKSQVNWSRSYWEYQLKDSSGALYNSGAWVRERDLKAESRQR